MGITSNTGTDHMGEIDSEDLCDVDEFAIDARCGFNLEKTPSLTLLDEFHLYPRALDSIKEKRSLDLIYDLTATPHEIGNIFKNAVLYNYSAEQALKDGAIVPLTLKYLNYNFSEKKQIYDNEEFINSIYALMCNTEHFNGGKIINHKTLIYLPSIKDIELASNILRRKNLNCYEIHSKNTKCKNDIEIFKNTSGECIALACKMIGVGYSDNHLDVIMYFRNGEKDDVTQAIGSALRINSEKTNKNALVFGFNDIKIDAGIIAVIKASEQVLKALQPQPTAQSHTQAPLVFSTISTNKSLLGKV
jgi:hypothetical protein